jgi:hypothetical protein
MSTSKFNKKQSVYQQIVQFCMSSSEWRSLSASLVANFPDFFWLLAFNTPKWLNHMTPPIRPRSHHNSSSLIDDVIQVWHPAQLFRQQLAADGPTSSRPAAGHPAQMYQAKAGCLRPPRLSLMQMILIDMFVGADIIWFILMPSISRLSSAPKLAPWKL